MSEVYDCDSDYVPVCWRRPDVHVDSQPPTEPFPKAAGQIQATLMVSNARGAISDGDYQRAILLLEQAAALTPGSSTIASLLAKARDLRVRQVAFEQAIARAEAKERQEQETLDNAIAAALKSLDSLRQPIDSGTTVPGFQATDPAAAAQPPGFRLVTVDPRTLITPDIYRTASKELARLKALRHRFERKLGDVRRWNHGLQRDDQEFEVLRVEAQKDLMYELLEHAPISWGLGELKEAGALSPTATARIETGWEALKGVVNTWRGVNAREDSDRVAKVVDGNIALRRAMVAIPSSLSPRTSRWLAGFGKVYDASAKFMATSAKDQKSFEDWANVFVKVGEAVAPQYVGVPVLLQHVGIRYAKDWSAKNAQESLTSALGRGWNADIYLSRKLEVLDAQIGENQRLVDGYLAVHRIPPVSTE